MATKEIKLLTPKETDLLLVLLDLQVGDIAAELGLSPSAISKALSGKKNLPTVVDRACEYICKVLKKKMGHRTL